MLLNKHKSKKELSRKARYFKYARRVLLIYIIYLFVGALLPFASTKQVSAENKAALTEALDLSSGTYAERATILETNSDALLWRLAAIQAAEERIIISSFSIRPSESWSDIGSALHAAADRGVQVQILVDGALSRLHMGRKDEFYALGCHENIEIKYYNTVSFLKPWTFNGRLHDKYLIADNKYLIVGGRNCFDYFLGDYESVSTGYDRDVFIFNEHYGSDDGNASIVSRVTDYFEEMWISSACKTKFADVPFYKNITSAQEAIISHDRVTTMAVPDEATIMSGTVPVEHISFIANPIHIFNKEPFVWEAMLSLMENANERVLIQTPYIVCSGDMYEGLSSLSDSVSTEILINSIASGGNIVTSSDYLKNKQKVVDTGIDLYEYQGDYSSHAKSAVIDDNISIIGSFNFDMRSTYIDTEMIMVIYGEEFNALLTDYIEEKQTEALLLDSNGNYVENKTTPVKETDSAKMRTIRILSIFSGAFRNLL